jgi:hypothetical protein
MEQNLTTMPLHRQILCGYLAMTINQDPSTAAELVMVYYLCSVFACCIFVGRNGSGWAGVEELEHFHHISPYFAFLLTLHLLFII